MKQRRDIYQEVTDRIIEGLKNPGDWSKPWACLGTSVPHNTVSGRPYSGINLFILAMTGFQYTTQRWLTFKQARELGGSVKKGEHGTTIVFWKILEKEKEEGVVEKIPLLRTFTVFNVEQCENLDESKMTKVTPPTVPAEGVIEIARRLGASVKYGVDRACFIPSLDVIHMPSHEAFRDHANHEATLLHELVHWTGHNTRLDRIKHHGYAEEELVAEIGAAMAGAVLGVPYEGLQHESYIASWLKALQDDKKHIFQAAKLAQRAVDFIVPACVAEEREAA